MKNKNGFTLIELLGVIVILSILLTMATVTYTTQLKRSKEKVIDIEINSFEDAAASALEDCETNIGTGASSDFCNSHPGMIDVNAEDNITLDELVRYQYIERIKSPYDSKEFCTGSLKVKRVGINQVTHTRKNADGTTSTETWESDDSSSTLIYDTCLTCSGKTTCLRCIGKTQCEKTTSN